MTSFYLRIRCFRFLPCYYFFHIKLKTLQIVAILNLITGSPAYTVEDLFSLQLTRTSHFEGKFVMHAVHNKEQCIPLDDVVNMVIHLLK